jgi:hypothetical protein
MFAGPSSDASEPADRSSAIAMRVSILLPLVAWLTVSGAFVRADMADGLAAFDAGDYATAFEEWRALAEAGELEAQVALAGLYLAGQGTRADAAEALRWYRLAADRGDAVAQLNLGDLLNRGLGAARDPVGAYVWFTLAAAQGRRWPALRRDEIGAQLSPAQRAEAEARLEAWRRSH